jgi:hypothetical protein
MTFWFQVSLWPKMFFIYLLAICFSSLEKLCLVYLLSYWVDCSFAVNFFEYFRYSACICNVRWILGNDFLPLFRVLLHSSSCLLFCPETFKCDVIPFSNSCLYFLSYNSHVQEIFVYTHMLRIFPVFSSSSIKCSSLMLRLILTWILYSERDMFHSSLCGYPAFQASFVKDTILSLIAPLLRISSLSICGFTSRA